MGGILSQFKQFTKPRNQVTSPLLNISLSKLREYHGSFKSLCDTFTLDLSDFQEIFKVDKSSFEIWDTEGTELIDALELFSGLVIFSDCKFEDKIRFVFDLFDFNELNSLSIMDLEFMLSSCLSSTFKINGIDHDMMDKELINKFLSESFALDSRINISQLVKYVKIAKEKFELYRWCAKSPEIHEFFSIIKKEMALVKTVIAHASVHAGLNKLVSERRGGVSANKKAQDMRSVGTIFNNQKYRAKLDYLASLIGKTQRRRNEIGQGAIRDTIIKMNWVFGFRCNDVRHPLKHVGAERGKTVTEKLIYFTGCVVIVYDPKSNEQTHYLDHEREVISLAVSQSSLVATGELGELPAIHIWDCDTLQNRVILKGIHDLGIHLLAFMKNDEFIVSCGIRANSPLLIYNIKDTSLVLSTYLIGFALDLRPIVSYVATPDKVTNGIKYEKGGSSEEVNGNSFFASTQDAVFVYIYETGLFRNGEVKISDYQIETPITCCVALRVNASNPYLKAYAEEKEKSLIFITGHSGGKVFVWENMTLKEELVDYRSEILAITCLDFGVVIATDSSFLYFWDLNLKNNFKKFDLCSLQFKLFSFKITSIAPATNKMYLATTEGDVVEISLSQKKEMSKSTYSYKIQAQKIKNISKISGNMKAITLLEKPDSTLVFVAGDAAIISAFSLEDHDLYDLWSLGESITAIDIVTFKDGSNVFAMGTISGKIHLRYDWEELPKGYECGARIIDLKFSNDAAYLVAISEVSIVFIFSLVENSYFSKKPKKIEFEGECPISVNFSDNNKIILIGTSQKNHYISELNEQNPKPININANEIADKTHFSILNVRFPSHAKNFINTMQPVSFGINSNAILSADESGVIFYWKDKENLLNNCGGYLKGHGSQIARLCIAKNTNIFYSLGTTDRTLIEWKINTLTEEVEEVQSRSSQEDDLTVRLEDETLIRELEYSTFFDNLPDKFKDSLVFFRGTTNSALNSILQEHVEPFEDVPLYKRVPNSSLELHFIYGFQSYEKRNTLFYGHLAQGKLNRRENEKEDIRMVTEEEEKNVFLNKNSSLFIQPQTHKLIMYSKETSDSVSFYHNQELCERYFIYFASRIAIIYDPITNRQRFYEGHRYRITSMCMHPSKAIVATGETSPSPVVHVWSIITLEPLKIIKTFHKNGILSLQFSKNGIFLVTIGVDLFFSVQVTKWKSEEIIAFRNTDRACIFDVVFNPYDKCEFATVGQHNISIWGVDGRSLVRKEWINVKDTDMGSSCVFTAATYFNYKMKREIGSDLIVGDNFGGIGLVTSGKYYSLREEAHSKMINCIKVTEFLANDLMILTSGQDEAIRFWDVAFNLLYDVNLRKVELPEVIELPQNEDVSIQSIDVYGCEGPQEEEDGSNEPRADSTPKILLGTRNGYILEATVHKGNTKNKKNGEGKIHISFNKAKAAAYNTEMPEFDPEEDSSESSSEDEAKSALHRFQPDKYLNTKMSLDFTLYLSCHSGTLPAISRNYQQKVLYALHPKLDIMFTVGEDQYLCVWDIEKCTLLKQVKQDMKDSTPTALKITTIPDGEILAVGFSNGSVYLLDAKMTANPLGKYQNTYVLPSLNIVQGIKGHVPVLNIEFSSKGDIMAISYDNPKPSREGEIQKTENEGSCIEIYFSRASPFTGKARMSEKNLYSKQTDRTIKFQSPSQSTEAPFHQNSDDYLLIYYQGVDNNQIRVNEDTQGHYAVWDLKAKNRFGDPEMIKNIKWKKLNFPNSLYAQYLFYPNILGADDSKKDTSKLTRRPIISSMFDYGTSIAAGSTIGDLHFFKKRGLDSEKDFLLENLKPEKMCMSKTYNAHVSFVNQVETKGNYLFSTGMHDGCVMQWRFIEEEEQWEADFREFQEDKSKIVTEVLPLKHQVFEVPPKNEFNKLVNEILPLRHQVYEVQQNLDEVTEPEISLDLEAVIGRKALNRRNNLFYDFYGRIIYSVGTLIMMYNPAVDFELKGEESKENHGSKRQEILKVDGGNVFSSAPEISAYTLSADKRFLCAGTQELNARIIIWEICSRTCTRTLKLSNCTAIQIIKFAYDSQHICALGTTPDYTQVVYLIDSAKPQVLGCINLLNTLIFKIKDINFFPNTTYKFITCGVQHMNIWTYAGSALSFSACVLENPKDPLAFRTTTGFYFDSQDPMQNLDVSMNLKDKSKEEEDLFVFLCLCFVQNLVITGGEDGFIYVWKDFKVIKKQTAHYKYPVLCLNSASNSSGQDSRIVVWSVFKNPDNNSYQVEMIHECSISTDDITNAYIDLKNHVQSVFIDNRRILAGTRTGDIYEFKRQSRVDKKAGKYLFDRPKARLVCQDDEIPKGVGFSHDMDRIFGISQTGLFSVWNVKDLQIIYSKHLSKVITPTPQVPPPTVITAMMSFKFSPLVLIAFDTQIQMLSTIKSDYGAISTYDVADKAKIKDIKLSVNEKYLAVLLDSESHSGCTIDIYDLEREPGAFRRFHTIDEPNINIDFIDFSLDNTYLLCKDDLDEISVTDIPGKKKINYLHIRSDVEWMSDGLRISDRTKGIKSYYTDDNKILKLVRIGQSTLAVTDEMGTIRLFKYPCEAGSSTGYYKCYTEHVNYVNNFVMSVDENYVLTTSESDKSIFLWNITYLQQNKPTSLSEA